MPEENPQAIKPNADQLIAIRQSAIAQEFEMYDSFQWMPVPEKVGEYAAAIEQFILKGRRNG